MDDLISRQAAIDALACLDDYEEEAIEALRKLPSAQPEIIKCRDCNNWDTTWTNNWAPDYHYCPMIDAARKGDFYCADAERRPDGSDRQAGGDQSNREFAGLL